MRIGFQSGGYRRQQVVRSVAAGLVTAACGLALVFTQLGADFERTVGLHWLFKHRGDPRQPPPDIAVVAITNETGKALGLRKEPVLWPRAVHAPLIEHLLEHNPRGIVFDVYFGDPNPGDDIFASAIKQADRVVLVEWGDKWDEPILTSRGDKAGSIKIEKLYPPAPLLATAAKAFAPFPLPEKGEATFQFWAFESSADDMPGDMPTAAAVALQLRALPAYEEWIAVLKQVHAPGVEHLPAHASELKVPKDMQTLRRMFVGDASLRQEVLDRVYGEPRDAETRKLLAALAALYAGPNDYYINFYGPPGTIRTIPYECLLSTNCSESTPQSGELTNSMIFVGRSDLKYPDHPDRFYTSFNGKNGVYLSGVEIMATAYANLLTQRTLLPPDTLLSALAVLAFGLVIGILVYLLPAAMAVPGAFALALLYYVTLQWRFNQADLWLPLATPWLVQLPLALLIGLMGQYLLERRKEKHMIQAVRYYLPDSLVRDLTQRQVDPTTLNRVVFGTCLATDMSDFIALAESKSPHELAVFMNEYFDALAQALKRHGVDVMEFRADMIMCAWIESGRSAGRGLNAAIEVREIIERFAQQYGSRHFKPRIGLQDGNFYVGHTGGGGRFLYSIVGDTANTAARLESLNKHLGTQVLAGESVVRDSDGLLLRPLGSFRLRGKTDATSVFEILGRKDSARADHLDLCAQFAEGLATFQRKEWLRAASLFEAITRSYVNDGPSRFYWACSQKYAVETPMYDGPAVIQMNEK